MVKSILWLGAATAAGLACAPAIAQDYAPAPGAPSACADACQSLPGPADYEGQAFHDAEQGDAAYRSGASRYSPGETSMAERRGGFAAVRTQSSSYSAYEARYFANRRAQGAVHHTVDRAGFLSWNGKGADFVSDGDAVYGAPPPPEADAGGPACPVGAGIRVLSCQYIPFTPPEVEQPLAINDEDFAYEGSAGPIGVSGGGGGGGGGSIETAGPAEGFGAAFARGSGSASASASASASLSTSINISGHFSGGGNHGGGGYGGGGWGQGGGHGGGYGGGGWGHGGGYGGGGYHGGGGGGGWGHGGGGHMGGGCGCGSRK